MAQNDTIRERNARHERLIQRSFDDLQPYSAEEDGSPAELTGSLKGVTAKLGLPRPARLVLGVALSIGLLAVLMGVGWAIAHVH